MKVHFKLLATLLFVATAALGQMTADQRAFDFQVLSSMFAKKYAPAQWKRDALNFDVTNIAPWLDRVRKAGSDLEYFEIALQYVSSLQDTHTYYWLPSSFAADAGMSTDIYEGKVLIDGINRSSLPVSRFPFQIGDEVVSVDGASAEDLITYISQFHRWGNPQTTRRYAAYFIPYRYQRYIPRAVELGDSAQFVIRRASGTLETYTIPWTKSGAAVTSIGPVDNPRTTAARRAPQVASGPEPDIMAPLRELQNWALPAEVDAYRGEFTDDTGAASSKYLIGTGGRNPQFRAGFPAAFVQRLGRVTSDFHFSGTYESGGYKIGFLRVPSFSPSSTTQAIAELNTEIDYFQKNTDGMVLDVTHNPGGGCYMADLAARFMPGQFYFFSEQIRPRMDYIQSFQSSLELARLLGREQWIIITYQFYLDALKSAYEQKQLLTEPVAACSQTGSGFPPLTVQFPAATVYSKPLIILVDEFSISAADIFPAMMQDNSRGTVVGMRTSGGGGSVSSWPAGFYSEAYSTNTNSLVVRNHAIATPEYPSAPYVENIGTRPDIQLDYMTRENLMNGGLTYVNQFTSILVDQIKQGK